MNEYKFFMFHKRVICTVEELAESLMSFGHTRQSADSWITKAILFGDMVPENGLIYGYEAYDDHLFEQNVSKMWKQKLDIRFMG